MTLLVPSVDPDDIKKSPAPDASIGYYPDPGFACQKPAPKTWLVTNGKAASAAAWILNLVEAVHWLIAVPTFILCWNIFDNSAAIEQHVDTKQRVFLLMLCPILQLIAGYFPIMMHVYEGWQIVHFENPLTKEFAVDSVNNEWLREAAYQYLFTFLMFGMVSFNLAVFGLGPWNMTFGIGCACVAFFGPQRKKATFTVCGQPVFPLAYCVMIPFILSAIWNLYAFYVLLAGPLHDHGMNRFLSFFVSLLGPVLYTSGGMIEGLVAESTFNQWWHFFAVVGLNAGLVVQIYAFPVLY